MKDNGYKNPVKSWDFNQVSRQTIVDELQEDADFAPNPGDNRKNTQGCRRKQRKTVPFDRRTNPERRKPRLSFKV